MNHWQWWLLFLSFLACSLGYLVYAVFVKGSSTRRHLTFFDNVLIGAMVVAFIYIWSLR